MEKQRRDLIAVTSFLAFLGIVLIVISLATDNWVVSNPKTKKNGTVDIETSRVNHVNFGLFKGQRTLNFGVGGRPLALTVSCEASEGVCVVYPDSQKQSASEYIRDVLNRAGNYSNITDEEALYKKGLFNYGFWVTSIISAALCIVFGLISVGFAIFNICGKPIETITGPMGLYLWNGAAFLFATLDMVMFVILFLTTLKKNYLLADNYDKFLLSDYTNLGYSFYLVLGAVILYLINIVLLIASGYKLRCSFSSEAEKVVDNGVILY